LSTSITYPLPDGATYIIPAVDNENWGQNVSNFLIAIPNGVIPRSGTYAFTGDVSITGFGFALPYLLSSTVNHAASGFVRLAKIDTINWRNNANSADLPLTINSLDQLTYNGTVIGAASGVLTITGTPHQIIASASTGNVTLSTPQNIDTTSNPTFGTVTANLTGTASGNLPLSGGTLSGALNLGSNQIHNVANGTSATDAVNLGQITGLATFQSGDLKAAAYSATPSGWLLCDGTSYPIATYPTLFAAIGYAYGGAGANFNVPNLVNRTPVGQGGSIAPSLGSAAGSTTHTLVDAEMAATAVTVSITDPTHFHKLADSKGGSPAPSNVWHLNDTGSGSPASLQRGTGGVGTDMTLQAASTGITASGQVSGSATPFSVVQPSLGVNWFIKI